KNGIAAVLFWHPGSNKIMLQPCNPATLDILHKLFVVHGAHFDFFVWLVWSPDRSTKVGSSSGSGSGRWIALTITLDLCQQAALPCFFTLVVNQIADLNLIAIFEHAAFLALLDLTLATAAVKTTMQGKTLGVINSVFAG